jgi:hypothetical protein
MVRAIVRIGPGIALAWALTGAPATAQTFCDPDKPIVEDRSDGYRDRGDRCEGVYAQQQVSGGFLEIASFTAGEVKYGLGDGALTLAWPAQASDQPVQIRAVSLRRNLHYQMDTRRPSGATTFEWPTDLLVQRRLRPDEVGLRAWTDFAWGRGAKELHLPLTVHQKAAPDPAGPYHLIVMPELSLGGLTGSLERLEDDDDFATVIADADLGSFYPAKEAITVELPRPDEPGIYRLRLIAMPEGSGPPVSTFVWFQHPGS